MAMRIAQFTFNAFSENTYVLADDAGEAIIIDPGMTDVQEDAILFEYITEENLIPRLILNTHCHLDHVFGNKFVAEKWGLVPHVHQLEKKVLDFAPAAGLMWASRHCDVGPHRAPGMFPRIIGLAVVAMPPSADCFCALPSRNFEPMSKPESR
jgi:glyoxylase-like metal-dependent hydrolase (beta-lactamase superfamily II)